jgi:hypothetical protein
LYGFSKYWMTWDSNSKIEQHVRRYFEKFLPNLTIRLRVIIDNIKLNKFTLKSEFDNVYLLKSLRFSN